MKKIILELRRQHQWILQLLDQPEKILELLDFIEKVHHPLEEEALFPLIASSAWLRQGGPRCSFHMGMRLERDPLGKIHSHLLDFYRDAGWSPAPSGSPLWLTPQNPLSIPMQEHAFSHNLSESLRYLLKMPESGLHQKYFSLLYNDFRDLLHLHIDKEDNCLFVICEANEDSSLTAKTG